MISLAEMDGDSRRFRKPQAASLFNMNGALVEINIAKVSSTDVEGMGYVIPISQVLELISSLMNE